MSDGIAPAIDKVGAPEPTAPEAEAGAPTMDTTAAPAASDEKKPEDKPEETKVPDGAGPAVGAPKPVEVTSVPETPINNRTPAGGSPRPELAFDQEPKVPPKEEESVVIAGVNEPAPTPATSQPDVNGSSKPEMTGALPPEPVEEISIGSKPTGEKRKADEPAAADTTTAATNGNGDAAEKKAKVDEGAAVTTNGKSVKGKKEKKPAPPVGRTARKTRSQGPVEV